MQCSGAEAQSCRCSHKQELHALSFEHARVLLLLLLLPEVSRAA